MLKLINQAKEHISKSEYKQAIKIYDEILEDSPNNISTLKNERDSTNKSR
jgi:hypothetical protein